VGGDMMGRGKEGATPSAATFRLDTPPFGSHHFASYQAFFLACSGLSHSATLQFVALITIHTIMRIFERNNDDPNVKLGKHPSVAACKLSPHRSWAFQPDLPITVRKNRPGGGTCVISLAISCYQWVPVDHMKAKPADRKTRSLRSTYIHALVMYQSNVFRVYTYWYILMCVEIHRWLHSSATCIGRKAHGIPMMKDAMARVRNTFARSFVRCTGETTDSLITARVGRTISSK
jgi:hypothetical protein